MVGCVAAQMIVTLLLTLPFSAAMRDGFVRYSVMLLSLKLYHCIKVWQIEIYPGIGIEIFFIFNPIFLLELNVFTLQITPYVTFSYALSAAITFRTTVAIANLSQRRNKLSMQRAYALKTLMRILNLLYWHIYWHFYILLQLPYKKMNFLFVSSTLIISRCNAIVGIIPKVLIGKNIYNSPVCNADKRNRCIIVHIMAS